MELSVFETGVLVGILVGEGHFGGDGKQPQVTVRMHLRHERLFGRLLAWCPGSRLYGPYHHGGRSYFQWMARGDVLREKLIPLLNSLPLEEIDDHVYERYEAMKVKYGL